MKYNVVLFILFVLGSVHAQEFMPFPPSRHLPENSVIDLSLHLHAPAGKHGRIQANGRGFKHNSGGLRFYGVNMTFNSLFPEKASDAEQDAERIARMGFNMVRIHHQDWQTWPQGRPKGIVLSRAEPDKLHPVALDRLHRLMAECIQRGVYINLNLHVSRHNWLDKNGEPLFIKAQEAKKVLEQEHHTALLKAYSKSLLTTVNPYTGLSPAEDPGIAIVEISNENRHSSGEWYDEFATFIREECGYKGLIAGTHENFKQESTQDLEITNHYHRHPDFKVGFQPGVDDGSIVTGKGKGVGFQAFTKNFTGEFPTMITEYNHPWPNYASSEAPLVEAVGFLTTEIGGILHFTWSQNGADKDYIASFFETWKNPAQFVHMPAAVIASKGKGYEGAGFGKKARQPKTVGAVTWTMGKTGHVAMRGKRVKGLFGYPANQRYDLGDGVRVKPGAGREGHCALSFTNLQGDHFPNQGTYLLAISAETKNTGAEHKGGEGPILAEILSCEVDLPVAADVITVHSLDADGRVQGRIPVQNHDEGCRIILGKEHPSLWYLVTMKEQIP